MEDLKEEILQLIMQYLGDEEYKETLHTLGAETKLYFDIKYFEELLVEGNWNKADKYFSRFTQNTDSHPVTLKVLDEIRKNMNLDASEREQSEISVEARVAIAAELKSMLMSHPMVQERLHFPPRPSIEGQKLKTMIEKSLDKQDINGCERDETDIMLKKTIDEDHECSPLDSTAAATDQTTTDNLMECDKGATDQTTTNNLMECDKGATGQNQ